MIKCETQKKKVLCGRVPRRLLFRRSYIVLRRCLSGLHAAEASFFFLVRSLWCLGRAFPWPVFETEASNQATQCKSKAWRRGVGGGGWGACALLTALSGSRDNKSIDCPSPVGAKCKQIEKDGEQSRLVTETDILNRGAATNEMPLWLFPSSPRYDGCHSCTHYIW